MERDASLDEFLDSGSDDDVSEQDTEECSEQDDSVEQDNGSVQNDSAEPADSGESSEGTADLEATSDPDKTVEPARSTGRWDPDGAECDACGETVARRWREDDQFRCVECKSW